LSGDAQLEPRQLYIRPPFCELDLLRFSPDLLRPSSGHPDLIYLLLPTRATLRLFAADAALFVTLFDLMLFPLLLGRVFLFASSSHVFPPSDAFDKQTDFARRSDLMILQD